MTAARRFRTLIPHPSSLIPLLLAACASAPPPPAPPPLTTIPRSIIDAFCIRLHDEGISAETAKDVVRTTQPLVTPQTITGLADAIFYSKPYDPFALAQEVNRTESPLPVEVPASGCAWRAVDETSRRSADIMTLELSAPFANPFAHNAYGLVARLSLGGDSATWYWLPLAYRDRGWVAGNPKALGMR